MISKSSLNEDFTGFVTIGKKSDKRDTVSKSLSESARQSFYSKLNNFYKINFNRCFLIKDGSIYESLGKPIWRDSAPKKKINWYDLLL